MDGKMKAGESVAGFLMGDLEADPALLGELQRIADEVD